MILQRIALLTLLGSAMPATSAAPDVDMRIDRVTDDASHAVFRGIVTGDAPEPLRYELSLIKTGASGVSRVRQAGTLMLEPGSENVTSSIATKMERDDRYQVDLRLYRGDQLVAEKVLLYPDANQTGN